MKKTKNSENKNTEVVINPFKDLKPTVDIETLEKKIIKIGDNEKIIKKKKKKLKIQNITDKVFFDLDDDEDNNENNKEEITHLGFIAQDIKNSLLSNNYDFAC